MRFSLRMLIVVMLVGGPLCAWGRTEWQRIHEAKPVRRYGIWADIVLESHSMDSFPEPEWYKRMRKD